MPRNRKVELPGTLKRSPPKAQRTYAKTLKRAEEEYGPGERAGRTAIAALKHSFEKVGDHWEAKAEPGPSDPQARRSTADRRGGKRARGETFGGVDVLGHTRQELYERAQALGIRGRSRMTKEELARAIASRQD
ncbi:ChaB family protein [Aromatoleum anaerobium]|uniref:Cation transport regulator ChaB n=1 Tax=Aromatoleum anaerobium TaxID=182180 RepID=A0ABX1PID0_9RHOO|nr:ChaB family protein [Aromatoleum anaerobium]MCK0508358.1 ChaB family protein [Aromatoleum anaerobium]